MLYARLVKMPHKKPSVETVYCGTVGALMIKPGLGTIATQSLQNPLIKEYIP